MKTFMSFLSGFILATISFYLITCGQERNGSYAQTALRNVNPLTDSEETSSDPDRRRMCHDCQEDGYHGVRVDEFYKNVARYNGTHVKDVNKEMQHANLGRRSDYATMSASRACTYSLNELKNFICHIENYAKGGEVDRRKLGVAFVFGVYPKNRKVYGQNYGSLHTLYMVPSINNGGMYELIDIKATAAPPAGFKQKLSPPYRLEQIEKDFPKHKVFMLDATAFEDPGSGETPPLFGAAMFGTLRTLQSNIANQGQLCPPGCKVILPDDEADY